MPSIPVYNIPNEKIQVPDTGERAFVQQAREVGALGREGLRVLDEGTQKLTSGLESGFKALEEHQDYSQRINGVRSHTQMLLDNKTDLDNITSTTSPDDMPNALTQYQQRTADRLDKWNSQFACASQKTQLWAAEQSQQYQLDQAKQTAQDSAINAGNKAILDTTHSFDNIAGTLQHPTALGLDTAARQMDQITQAALMNPYLTDATHRAHIQEKFDSEKGVVLYNGIFNAIRDDPSVAPALVDRFKGNLSATQQRELLTHQDQQTRVNIAQQKADEATARQVEKNSFNQEMNTIESGIIDPQGHVHVTSDMLARAAKAATMPGAAQEPGRLQSTLQFLFAQEKAGPNASDPVLYNQFANRIFLPQSDANSLKPQEVFDARTKGLLSDKDFEFYLKGVDMAAKNPTMAADQRSFNNFAEGFKRYFTQATATNPLGNPSGYQRYSEWYQDMHDEFFERRAKGEVPKTIFDDMTQANRITPYYQGMAAANKNLLKPAKPGQEPQPGQPLERGGPPTPLPPLPKGGAWKPGESMDDLSKRLQGQP